VLAHVTVAERKPNPEDFPGIPSERLVAGSVVFSPPPGRGNVGKPLRLVEVCSGRNLARHPEGPDWNRERSSASVLHSKRARLSSALISA